MSAAMTDYRPCVADRAMDAARRLMGLRMIRDKEPARVLYPNYWNDRCREAEDDVVAAADWIIAYCSSRVTGMGAN